jgi:hypothetical protein
MPSRQPCPNGSDRPEGCCRATHQSAPSCSGTAEAILVVGRFDVYRTGVEFTIDIGRLSSPMDWLRRARTRLDGER